MEFTTIDKISENLDGKRKPITSSDRIEGNIPYYGASGIVDYVEDYIFNESLLLVSEDGANLLARSTPIAFSIEGKSWVNNHAHVLRFANMIQQKYVELYLNHISLEAYITGSAQPKLNQKKLNEIPIPVVSEQEMIDAVITIENIQNIIRKRNEELDTLDKLIKSRFVELFGDIVLNPNEYEEGFVSEYCKMTQGTQIPMSEQRTDYQQGYYRYLYIRDLKYNDDNWIYVQDKYDDKKLTSKDLVVVNTGNTAGEIYYGKDGILSNNLFKVSFDNNVLDTTYMFAYFSSQQFQNMLWSEMKEGTQPHLGHKIFGSKKLLVPPMELQNQFATFVEQTDKSKVAVQKALDESKLLLDSLMQKYFE